MPTSKPQINDERLLKLMVRQQLFTILKTWKSISHSQSVTEEDPVIPIRDSCFLYSFWQKHQPSLLSGSNIDGFVRSRVGAYGLEMLVLINRDAKEIQRHRRVLGRTTQWKLNEPVFISYDLKYPNPQQRKKTKDCFITIQVVGKVITILTPKTQSPHTLGQDILLVKLNLLSDTLREQD